MQELIVLVPPAQRKYAARNGWLVHVAPSFPICLCTIVRTMQPRPQKTVEMLQAQRYVYSVQYPASASIRY